MKELDETVELLKALADPTRMKIVRMLNEQQRMFCVNAIAHRLGISQSAVSQHLRILKQAKLVNGERKGYHVHYSVDKERVKSVGQLLLKLFE
jgi:DNA-binding transcriptional ArsR family regulator